MGAAEALILLVYLGYLVVPLVVVVVAVIGVRRLVTKQRALDTRLARLEDATLDHQTVGR
jgi:hypothetical protein